MDGQTAGPAGGSALAGGHAEGVEPGKPDIRFQPGENGEPVAVRFRVRGVPHAQPRPRFVNGRVVSTLGRDILHWRAIVWDEVCRLIWDWTDEVMEALGRRPVEVEMWFLLPTRVRERWGRPCPEKPDVDNLAKPVLDVMVSGDGRLSRGAGLLADDKTVADLVVRKRWCDPKEAGVVVVIRPIAPDLENPFEAMAPPEWLADEQTAVPVPGEALQVRCVTRPDGQPVTALVGRAKKVSRKPRLRAPGDRMTKREAAEWRRQERKRLGLGKYEWLPGDSRPRKGTDEARLAAVKAFGAASGGAAGPGGKRAPWRKASPTGQLMARIERDKLRAELAELGLPVPKAKNVGIEVMRRQVEAVKAGRLDEVKVAKPNTRLDEVLAKAMKVARTKPEVLELWAKRDAERAAAEREAAADAADGVLGGGVTGNGVLGKADATGAGTPGSGIDPTD